MRSPNKILALLTLAATLTISDFPLIQNPNSKIQNSQALAQTPDARKAEAKRLLQQGIQQAQTSQFEAALQSWQQALIIYREIKDLSGEEASLGNLGITYSDLGDYTKAIDYLQQSLAIAREIKNRQGEGRTLGNLGNAYSKLGDDAKAIEYFRQSLAIAREIKNHQGESASLGNLGATYRSLGDDAKAIEYFQQSLAIVREINDRQGEGTVLAHLGAAYLNLKDLPRAIEFVQQSLAIAREINDRQLEAIAGEALGNLGVAYHSLGDYAKAVEYFQQSLAIAQEINDRFGKAKALGGLGNAYHSIGDYAKVIDYQQQSLAISREIKNRVGEGTALGSLGIAYQSLGDYAKAVEYFQQSLALAQDSKNRQAEEASLGNLGIAYLRLGDYAKAIEYQQQSLALAQEIKNRNGEGTSLGSLGTAYSSLGNYAKAIEYQQQSLALAREVGDKNGEGSALNSLGVAFHKSGNLPEAEKILRTAIDVWEFQRGRLGKNDAYKVSIFEEQVRTYRILQKVLIAQNNSNAALEIAERGRARAFVELLASRNAKTNDSPNSPINPPSIELLQQIAHQQNATLVEYSIILDAFKINGKEEGKESELYIWVIKPTGEVTFRKADLKPLWQQQNTTIAELVTNSRESIGVRNRSELASIVVELSPEAQQRQLTQQRQKLQQLHQLLIEPIAKELPADPQARVIFIPQSDLFLVPFPALVDASGQYLIGKHTILTAPSIQALDLTRQQQQRLRNQTRGTGIGHQTSNPQMLIVGNPLMPNVWNPQAGRKEQLSYLKGAEKEAEAIAQFFNAPVLLGEQASERAIKQQISNARIVHLATHGLLDYGTPEDTGVLDFPGAVALTPGEGEDGLLTSAEIVDMNLNAELVVLSACDTGRGRIRSEGVIGLSRSLISAGVPSVIVSLWAVDDAATTELMQEFYQQWQQNPDKAQALRQAMLTTMQKHPDPRLWAAFTLIGEAE